MPYGLARYGVAPDHQGTRAITRQFDRLFEREKVTFEGGVAVGTDVSLAALRRRFDVVALATGLYGDRRLGVPGDDLAGIVGAGALTRRINGHPEENAIGALGPNLVIVGNGNVAIDVLRLMIRDTSTLDPGESVRIAEAAAGLRSINVIGRSTAAAARFDPVLIRELGKIEGVRFIVEEAAPLSDKDVSERTRIDAVRALRDIDPGFSPRVVVTFRFGWVPVEVTGRSRVHGVVVRPTGGEPIELAADGVVTAIGFEQRDSDPIKLSEMIGDAADTAAGRLDHGLYAVGWFRYGPRGRIPDARVDARAVAATITADWHRKSRLQS
jgi:ferredoxin--NADP+ reductase